METSSEMQAVPEVQAVTEAPKTPLAKAQAAVEKANAQAQAKLSEWVDQGKQFRGQLDNCQFAIGDWLVLGGQVHGRNKKLLLAEAAKITGYSHSVLYRTLQVSSWFPVSRRREFLECVDSLSWEHFYAVSGKRFFGKGKDARDHDKALQFLRGARSLGLSATKMKEEMRAPKPEVEGQRVTFRIPDQGYDRLRTLAYARHSLDGDTPAALEEIVLAALYDYFVNPTVTKEIEDYEAAIVAKEIASEIAASLDGKVAWKVIDSIMRELTDGKDDTPDPHEIRERFEKCTHRVKGYEEPQEWEFSYPVFLSALRKSKTFAKYFSEADAHDFAVSSNLYTGHSKVQQGMPTPAKARRLAEDALVSELKPALLALAGVDVEDLTENIDWSAYVRYGRYCASAMQKATLIRRAITALKKEGKVEVVKGRLREKAPVAAPVTPAPAHVPDPPMSVADYDRLHANDPEDAVA